MPRLEEYERKRDFTKTAEPRPVPVEGPPPGGPDVEAKNLVFVVQQHAAYRAGMHWDFRLEVDGVLKSWPLRRPPPLDPKQKRGATMVEDHPYDYRTFEGVIPRGEYGGGHVIVWDEGIYTPDEDGVTSWNDKQEGSRRMLAGIEQGKVSFTLNGSKLKGSFALVKTKYRPDSWLLIKHRDQYVSERDLLQEDVSVRSGLTIQDLREGKLPPASPSVQTWPVGAREAPLPDARKERPMLATLVEDAFDAPGWLWEPKLDGIRILAFAADDKVELRSRRGVDVTKTYPRLVRALEAQPARAFVLDGEVCALDENGAPRFQLIQPRINLTKAADIAAAEAEIPVVFFAFDLTYLDGHDLRAVPLRERKDLLASRIVTGNDVRLIASVEEDGVALAETAQLLGFEGVVGKRMDSRYEYGSRSRSWVKVKTRAEQEFVVGGYTPGEGARSRSFGALAIGYYEDGRLRYAGNVGSGFNDKMLAGLMKQLRALETDRSPFDGPAEGKVTWVEPRLIAEVKFAEWTKDGRLRAPVFVGLRDDIEPSQVRREAAAPLDAVATDPDDGLSAVTPDGSGDSASNATGRRPGTEDRKSGASPAEGTDVKAVLAQLDNPKATFVIEVGGEKIKLSNLDKEFWPAHNEAPPLTKRDLVRYYVELAPVLLPHLQDRPLTLTRYPNGVTATPFYQKHYAQPIPSFVDTVAIYSSHNDADGQYILCNNLPTLVWLAQIADLELHAWMSRTDPAPDAVVTNQTFDGSEPALDDSVLNYPDYMIFDLDPYIYSGREGKGEEPEFNQRGWDKTVEIALALKELLDQMRLSSYVKTSGKTGLHVYVPILRHYDYDTVRAFTATIGRFLLQQHPKDLTMDWDTSKRAGKIFFDHNQNTRGKTLAAQYSLRPTPWAGVSTPVRWTELPTLEPTAFNLRTLPARIATEGDIWADVLQRKNDIGALLGG